MKTDSLKKRNKKKLYKVAGWLMAALLLFVPLVQASTDPLQELYSTYSNYTFDQLMGEYNTVVELHDNIRAEIENQPDTPNKATLIKQDDHWCEHRQAAWENAIRTRDRQELCTVIVLEYLRCGEMKEKLLEGSSK